MSALRPDTSGHASGLLAERRDRAPQAVRQLHPRLEADELACPRDVEVALGLAVGARRVPLDLALEAGQPADELGEVADPRLAADAEVDRIGDVEPLGGQQQAARGVVDVEEFARWVA